MNSFLAFLVVVLFMTMFFLLALAGAIILAMLQAWIVEAWLEWRYGYYKEL